MEIERKESRVDRNVQKKETSKILCNLRENEAKKKSEAKSKILNVVTKNTQKRSIMENKKFHAKEF